MPSPTTISPNTGNIMVGKGIVTFQKNGTGDFRDLGHVSEFVVTPEIDTLEHFSSREGTKKKDLVIVLQQKATVKMTMEEFTPENAALSVQGTVDEAAVGGPEVEIFGATSVTGHLRYTGTNDQGPKITIDLYNVSFNPDGDLSMISDEFNGLEVTAEVLAAESGTFAGKFGIMKWTNMAVGS